MISIIIPTLNEEELLPNLLESIDKQTFKDYEIIIADAGSKDNTISIAKKHNARVVKGGVPAVGRNNGAKAAKGDILLFLDSDSRIPTDFLEKAIKEFKGRNLGSATVSLIPISTKFRDKLMYDSYNAWQKMVQYVDPHAAGICIFSRKDIFDKTNGFDEGITFCEDHAFVRKTKRHGKFIVINNTKLYNSVRRLDSEGRANMALKMIYTSFYRTFIGEIKQNNFTWIPGSTSEDKSKPSN